MIDKSELKSAFDAALRNARFAKKSGSWYRSGSDAIVVLNLQKSPYGDNYYLNVDISLKALSSETFPKGNHCHIQMRADDLIGDEIMLLNRALDLEEGNEQDLSAFIELMNQTILPLTAEFLCLDQLREHYKKSTFKAALLFWQARELLENPGPMGS